MKTASYTVDLTDPSKLATTEQSLRSTSVTRS